MPERSAFDQQHASNLPEQWADRHPVQYAALVGLGSAIGGGAAYALVTFAVSGRVILPHAIIFALVVGGGNFVGWRIQQRRRQRQRR